MQISSSFNSNYNFVNTQKESKVTFSGLRNISKKVKPEIIKTNNAKLLLPLIAFVSSVGVTCLKNKAVKQNDSINEKDVFIKNNTLDSKTNIEVSPSLEKFKLSRYKYANINEYIAKHGLIKKELHTRRMKVYGTTEKLPAPRLVSSSQYKAMCDIQDERGEYSSVKKKLHNGLPLNETERCFVDATIEAMEPTMSKRTLWRSIHPFDGLEEQIRKGKIVEKSFSSTCTVYSDFYGYWPCEEIESNGNGIEAVEECMLKINIAENTPILDCNAAYKPDFGKIQYTRMSGEVILPPGEFIVKGYDAKLKILEVDFVPKV